MANNIYTDGDADQDANNPNNWSLAQVPTGTDVMFFTNAGGGGSENNCNFSGNISCAGINVTSDYGGDIDMVTHDLTTSSDATFAGGSIFDCGTGDLNCSGNFANGAQTTWTRGLSTIVMNGAGTTITGSGSNDLTALTINENVEVLSSGTKIDVRGNLTVANGKTLTLTKNIQQNSHTATVNGTVSIPAGQAFIINGSLAVTGTGEVSGDGTLGLRNGGSVTDASGTIEPAAILIKQDVSLVAGTYGSATTVVTCTQDNAGTNKTLTFVGDCDFPGDIKFDNDKVGRTYTIDTGDNNVTFGGDVEFDDTGGTTPTWTEPTTPGKIITFDGTTIFTGDVGEDSLGDVTVAANANLALASNMECDDFIGSQGATVTGVFLLTCDTFDLTGVSGNPVTWTDVDVTTTAAGTAAWSDVSNSDALPGADITADANSNNNGGNDAGWLFPAVGNPWYQYAQEQAVTA